MLQWRHMNTVVHYERRQYHYYSRGHLRHRVAISGALASSSNNSNNNDNNESIMSPLDKMW